jgi:hypothetical protein
MCPNVAGKWSTNVIQSQQLAGAPSALVDQVADSIIKVTLDGTFTSGQLPTGTDIAQWLAADRVLYC